MGNSQTSANEAVLSFMTIFLAVYALGVAVALRAYYLLEKHWFDCGERPRHRGEGGTTWYSKLRKTRGFPGTTAYVITSILIYFFQAYCAWRVWINVPAQQNKYGIAYLYLVFFHLVVNAVASEILLGLQELTMGLAAYALSFILSGVALVMLGLVTWQSTTLPSVALFVLQCIPTAGVLAVLVCVAILRVKNSSRDYDSLY